MKTIQIVIDEPLLRRIDRECKDGSRSAFFRKAAEEWLKQLDIRQLESKQRRGYVQHPVKPGEFSVWETEQVWTD